MVTTLRKKWKQCSEKKSQKQRKMQQKQQRENKSFISIDTLYIAVQTPVIQKKYAEPFYSIKLHKMNH